MSGYLNHPVVDTASDAATVRWLPGRRSRSYARCERDGSGLERRRLSHLAAVARVMLKTFSVGQPGVLDLLADFRGGTGLWMNARAHVLDGSGAVLCGFGDRGAKSAINSSNIALARNKGQLRRGIARN
jgi:hypothetical protein